MDGNVHITAAFWHHTLDCPAAKGHDCLQIILLGIYNT
jgi:hypothetical protein